MLNTQFQTFKTATDKSFAALKARGNNIKAVDSALKAYWREMNGTRNATREIACLNEIVLACKDWLKLKQGKSEFRTTTFTRTEEVRTLFVARRTAHRGRLPLRPRVAQARGTRPWRRPAPRRRSRQAGPPTRWPVPPPSGPPPGRATAPDRSDRGSG